MEFKTHREDSTGQNVILGDILSFNSTPEDFCITCEGDCPMNGNLSKQK